MVIFFILFYVFGIMGFYFTDIQGHNNTRRLKEKIDLVNEYLKKKKSTWKHIKIFTIALKNLHGGLNMDFKTLFSDMKYTINRKYDDSRPPRLAALPLIMVPEKAFTQLNVSFVWSFWGKIKRYFLNVTGKKDNDVTVIQVWCVFIGAKSSV